MMYYIVIYISIILLYQLVISYSISLYDEFDMNDINTDSNSIKSFIKERDVNLHGNNYGNNNGNVNNNGNGKGQVKNKNDDYSNMITFYNNIEKIQTNLTDSIENAYVWVHIGKQYHIGEQHWHRGGGHQKAIQCFDIALKHLLSNTTHTTHTTSRTHRY